MKYIFEPVKLKYLNAKNRLVRSATWEGIAAPDGSLTEKVYSIYEELAKGGVGVIITGFTSVAANDHYFDGMMRLCDDHLIPQYRRLTDVIHAQDAAVIAQLALGACYRTVNQGHFQQVEPDEMTLDEIHLVRDQFVAAAVRGPEGRQTTRDEELIQLAEETGMNARLFRQHYTDGSARAAFLKDLAYTRFLGIRGLPAGLIQCGEQSALVSGMIGFNGFVTVIEQLQLRNQACNEGDGR